MTPYPLNGTCSECSGPIWMKGMCRPHYHSIWLPKTRQRLKEWDEVHREEKHVVFEDDPLEIPREPMPTRFIDPLTVRGRAAYFLPGL